MAIFNFWRRHSQELPQLEDPLVPIGREIRESALGVLGAPLSLARAFTLPQAAPGVIAQDPKLACDSACDANFRWALAGAFAEGLGFLGYPYLAELKQRPEYRRPAEILAKEMTRKWVRLQGTGDDDKRETIARVEAERNRLGAPTRHLSLRWNARVLRLIFGPHAKPTMRCRQPSARTLD